MQAPPHVRPQRVADILIGQRQVEPVRVKVAAAPALRVGVFRIVPVGHHGQKVLIAADAAHVLRRPRPGAAGAGRDRWNGVECNMLLDLDIVVPVVAEVVELGENRPGLAAEVE